MKNRFESRKRFFVVCIKMNIQNGIFESIFHGSHFVLHELWSALFCWEKVAHIMFSQWIIEFEEICVKSERNGDEIRCHYFVVWSYYFRFK